ncbi:uncharacterized protein LOC110713067 [Chenopodium quinoa]|uniref:uncharacterized protein LOC110713067 n=1 Tax=Chenopodium quinoa TaxID=63459 RepID=UPI000B781CDD|nr:uncharacterized protein LOC110713067 [Chenopodium quinoa]
MENLLRLIFILLSESTISKISILLTLDPEKVQYSNWVELFKCHAHAFNVLDHIDSKTKKPADVFDAMWKKLDSVVKNWIYDTISIELLETVLCKGDTTQQLWNKLKEIFQDNKTTRAVYLENQFNQVHLSIFSDIASYCRELKNLKDQLANVDQPVSEQKLVIRLVSGLMNTDFDTVAATIQQTEPLPSFKTARSRLLLEESRRANDVSASASSFVAQSGSSGQPTAATPQQQ